MVKIEEVNVTPEFLNDFNNFLEDLKYFMSFNIVHIDKKGKDAISSTKLAELAQVCVQNGKKLDIFKQPFNNYYKFNTEIFNKNKIELWEWIKYFILIYCEKILKTCEITKSGKQELYDGRFNAIKTHYSKFSLKYLN